jgi:hypothetical protein
MKKCVMCYKEFEEKDLDFLGRCEPCFRKYLNMPRDEKPNLGIPFTPISRAEK